MAEEKSTVLGIRLDTEERKRFDEFVNEEGKNNKDFLNTLLNLYELNKGKVKNINLIGDIEVLEGYTNKIQQTFINIIDKLENQKGDIVENSQKDLQIYKDKVESFRNMIMISDSEKIELKRTLEDNVKALDLLREQNKQAQQSLTDKTTIVEEYKNKNDTLAGILEEYKGYKTENQKLKQLLIDAQGNNDLLNDDIKNRSFIINKLNDDLKAKDNIIDNLKFNNAADIKKLEQNNKKELEQSKKENELNIKLAVAEIKEELNNKLNKEQLKHNADIEQYQAKYKSLLEEIDMRTIPKAKKDNVAAKDNK